MSFLYVRADESGIGSPGSGSVDADFDVDWLADGRPGRPAKVTGGSASWTISPSPAVTTTLVAVCNHTVDAGASIGISGSVSTTITVGSLPADRIPRNPFASVGSTSVSSLVVAVSGNSVDVVIGEVYFGLARTLERQIRLESTLAPAEPFPWEGVYGSVPPYDEGTAFRRLRGDTYVTASGLADIEAWYLSTRRGTRPTLIVPDSTVNDAWLVTFHYEAQPLKAPTGGTALWRVSFEFLELPRSRW